MAFHADETTGSVHIPYAFSYADAAARTGASGFVTADLGKLARQLDDNSLWMLTATTPTWVSVATAGGYTDEQAQDAIGAMIADTTSINLTYTDATPELTADAIFGTSAGTVAEGDHGHSGVVTGFSVPVGNGTDVITSGEPMVLIHVPVAMTITGNRINADAVGDLVFGVAKSASGDPTSFASIVASAPPTLSSAQSSSDDILTGWTTTVEADRWLKVTVTGTPATITRASLALVLTRAI